MRQKALCLRCYSPIARVAQLTPAIHVAAYLVDNRRWVVGLLVGREVIRCELQFRLPLAATLLRFRNRCDELGTTTVLKDFPGRLAIAVELPIAIGVLVWGVEYRFVEERFVHGGVSSRDALAE